jgi:hypothetical protein
MSELTSAPDAIHEDEHQPCSEPMTQAVANWYAQYTGGQFQTFLHEDGNQYLYLSRAYDMPKLPKTSPATSAENRR